MRCAVSECSSDNQSKNFCKDIMFHRFPEESSIRSIWINACKRKDRFNVNAARVCSLHFENNFYVRNLKYELLGYARSHYPKNCRQLKPNAIPTLYLPNTIRTKNNENNFARSARKQRRDNNKVVRNLLQTR